MFVCIPKMSLLPVKKKETYLIWYYIILYTFINCPVLIDIKQTLHYKVEYWCRVLESERCLFFMHCCLLHWVKFCNGCFRQFFFSFGRQKKWLLVVIGRWSSYTITIVWEFAWADSALVVLDVWSSYRCDRLNRFDCNVF